MITAIIINKSNISITNLFLLLPTLHALSNYINYLDNIISSD